MANSDVWINGLSSRQAPQRDMPLFNTNDGHLNAGKQNMLAVRADNSIQPASRWYPARAFTVTPDCHHQPVHVAHWSAFITFVRRVTA